MGEGGGEKFVKDQYIELSPGIISMLRQKMSAGK